MGRASTLTSDIIENLVKLVGLGMYEGPAAEFIGIDRVTLNQWKSRDGVIYDRLRSELQKAKAGIELRLVSTIVKSAVGVNGVAPNVNDAKWLLPRMAPERWARREILEIEPKGKTGGERATLDLSALTDEQLDNLEVMIKAALPPVRERLSQGSPRDEPGPTDLSREPTEAYRPGAVPQPTTADEAEGTVVSEQEGGKETWSAADDAPGEASDGSDDEASNDL